MGCYIWLMLACMMLLARVDVARVMHVLWLCQTVWCNGWAMDSATEVQAHLTSHHTADVVHTSFVWQA